MRLTIDNTWLNYFQPEGILFFQAALIISLHFTGLEYSSSHGYGTVHEGEAQWQAPLPDVSRWTQSGIQTAHHTSLSFSLHLPSLAVVVLHYSVFSMVSDCLLYIHIESVNMECCAIAGCSRHLRQQKDLGIIFHSFPKNNEIRLRWITAWKRTDKFLVDTACVCCTDHVHW